MSTDRDTGEAPHPVSIAEQIAEVEREIRQRERLYPVWIENHANGRKPQITGETANAKLAALRSAALSLRWLAANRDWIHEAHAQRREDAHWAARDAAAETAAAHPDVQAVKAAFPGSTVTAVREMQPA